MSYAMPTTLDIIRPLALCVPVEHCCIVALSGAASCRRSLSGREAQHLSPCHRQASTSHSFEAELAAFAREVGAGQSGAGPHKQIVLVLDRASPADRARQHPPVAPLTPTPQHLLLLFLSAYSPLTRTPAGGASQWTLWALGRSQIQPLQPPLFADFNAVEEA